MIAFVYNSIWMCAKILQNSFQFASGVSLPRTEEDALIMLDSHFCDISLSVVLYRDYESPLKMIESLRDVVDSRLRIHLYAVDNSNLMGDNPLCFARDTFRERAASYGFVEDVDAGDNLGFGAANNLALERADSEYHVFVNPDILFVEDALSKMKAFMDANPDIGMSIPRLIDESGELQYVYRREITVLDAFNRMILNNSMTKRDRWHCLKDKDYTKVFDVPFGQGSFLFARTDLLREIGGFDDRYFMYLEDADLCRRVNEVSRLAYCPDATVIHKWERGSHKSKKLLKHHLKSYMAYFRKWGLKLA